MGKTNDEKCVRALSEDAASRGQIKRANHSDIAAGFCNTMRGRTIELLRRADGDPIILPVRANARVFAVETDFHRMARRPGGVPRQQALTNARRECQRILCRALRTGQKV